MKKKFTLSLVLIGIYIFNSIAQVRGLKNSFVLVILLMLGTSGFTQIFIKADSVQLSNAEIWGVVFDAGDSLGITTIQNVNGKPHIYLRKIDYNDISQESGLKQLTFDNDFNGLTNLTDHKSIMLNNEVFVSFSTVGDQDLYLFKTDINGNRVGNITTVVNNSSDPTNDMILTTDSNFIYVMYYSPPFHHHVYRFNTNLTPLNSTTTTTNNHNNIGQAVFHNNTFYLFTGDNFGTNTSLLLTTWDNLWQPLASQIIIPSVNGDGNWLSTGAVFDSINNRWYIAMGHIYNGQNLGQEHIDLLAFDNNFNLLERLHISPSGYYRPHLILKNNYLYLSYDHGGSGVFLLRYQIQSTTGVKNKFTKNNINIFPNPAQGKVHIIATQKTTIKITDCTGRIIQTETIIPGKNYTVKLPGKGIYFISSTTNDKQMFIKKIINY